MWSKWVVDAGMGWPPVCVPVEGDLAGDYTLVVGFNLIGVPREGKVVAVVHPAGQEAADAFYEEHKDDLNTMFGKEHIDIDAEDHRSLHPALDDGEQPF